MSRGIQGYAFTNHLRFTTQKLFAAKHSGHIVCWLLLAFLFLDPKGEKLIEVINY